MSTKVKILLGTLLFLLLAFILLKNTDNKPVNTNGHFAITGAIKDLKADKVYLTFLNTKDSAKVDEGRFVLEGTIELPTKCWIYTSDGAFKVEFWLENSKINLTGVVGHECAIVGSKNQDAYMVYKNTMSEIISKYNKMNSDYSDAEEKNDIATKERITRLWKMLQVEELVFKKDFIKKYPKHYICLEPFNELVCRGQVDYDEACKLYSNLNDDVKNAIQGQKIDSLISVMKRTAVGQRFTDFTQPDKDGKPVKLSDLEGKYVLVTFWFSTSSSCRPEYPNLIKAYDKYHEKGLEILAVSFDKKKEEWLKAIDENKFPWLNVSDLKGWSKNDVALLYGINSLPRNFLIDPKGIIVADCIFGEDLEKRLSEIIK